LLHATAIKTQQILNNSVRFLYKNLRSSGLFVDLVFPQVKITNLTASYNDPLVNFDLESFYKRYQKLFVYEKELFPALKFEYKCPKRLTILIFHSGSIIFTGNPNYFVIQTFFFLAAMLS